MSVATELAVFLLVEAIGGEICGKGGVVTAASLLEPRESQENGLVNLRVGCAPGRGGEGATGSGLDVESLGFDGDQGMDGITLVKLPSERVFDLVSFSGGGGGGASVSTIGEEAVAVMTTVSFAGTTGVSSSRLTLSRSVLFTRLYSSVSVDLGRLLVVKLLDSVSVVGDDAVV